jgi:TPP-dependent pyruvate/acetoin dehydrogenase alpha subunit
VSLELGSDDYLLPQRAGALVARLKDSATASGNESGGNQSLRDISELTLATGMALGLRTAQRTGMVVTLARGSAEADREFSRLLAFASGSKLPVIYVLESALALQTRSKTAKPPLPVIIVDGSDTVAILRVIQECSRRARQGHGPALIRCTRTTTDPLKFMREYLRNRNLWSEEWQRKIEAEIRSARKSKKKHAF